ncbi:MAG: NAD(P)-dependent oxidoreductase [Actinomycetota bacterium]|jgi:3-hydroxyisobutyrate dehydrogenase|nr:NAD(P)-dependent oxidoreductase [Actinomycetota bacterium]MDA8280452.1 NAD(P)-dependent oxidoreductase [Actinomycetota bacterium]
MTTRVAFIGVGKMGSGMAMQLCGAGYLLRVFDTSEVAVAALVAAGAERASSAVQAVEGADVLFTSLPVPEVVESVYYEIFDRDRPGLVCVDVSTSDPSTVRRVCGLVEAHGARYLACPVGRGVDEAAAGLSSLFVGGDDATIDSVLPLLDVIGGSMLRMKTPEAAAAFKLVQNMVAMANLESLCEGYALAKRWGVSDEAFATGLPDTGAWSRQAEIRLPWLIDRDFAPRFTVALAAKDLRLAVEMAARTGVPVSTGAAALQQLVAAVNDGLGEAEVTSLFKVVERADPGPDKQVVATTATTH